MYPACSSPTRSRPPTGPVRRRRTDGAAGVPRLLRRVARSRRTCPGRDAGRRRPRCRLGRRGDGARYQRWSSVSRMDNPSGWVYRVGLNLARSRIRRLTRRRRVVAIDHTASEVPEPDVLEPAILRALRATGRPSLGGRVPAAPRMVRGGDRAGARHPAGHGQEPPAPGHRHARRPARPSSSAKNSRTGPSHERRTHPLDLAEQRCATCARPANHMPLAPGSEVAVVATGRRRRHRRRQANAIMLCRRHRHRHRAHDQAAGAQRRLVDRHRHGAEHGRHRFGAASRRYRADDTS